MVDWSKITPYVLSLDDGVYLFDKSITSEDTRIKYLVALEKLRMALSQVKRLGKD